VQVHVGVGVELDQTHLGTLREAQTQVADEVELEGQRAEALHDEREERVVHVVLLVRRDEH